MKPYGINSIGHGTDGRGGTKQFALKPSLERLPGKGGKIRSTFKNSAAKRSTRRIFKKNARRNALVGTNE